MKEDMIFSASSFSEEEYAFRSFELMSKILFKAQSMKVNTDILDTFLAI